ncbi:MAG: hypothetical protein ABR521_02895 [Gaiellaceae bacterium]
MGDGEPGGAGSSRNDHDLRRRRGSTGQATNLAQVNWGAVLHAGDLFVADARWNVVRRIDLDTGSEIIVAGNGLAGNGVESYNGDNIPAREAQLRSPLDLAIGPTGSLYIVDFGNLRIRKVDKLDGTGTITTVAGVGLAGYNGDGIPATAAQLNCPEGVDVDAAGNLYIADTANNRIRRVDAATQTITTIAGTGIGVGGLLCFQAPLFTGGYNGDNIPATTAQLNAPVRVELDGAGNVFIADFYNHRIRRVDAVSGIITTYAGTGTGGYNGDGIPAATAQIFNPRGMGIDVAGNLFFADQASHRVRRIAAALPHLITTVAGDGTKGVSGDGIPATSASLVFPTDVEAGPAGTVYLTDGEDYGTPLTFSRRVRSVDPVSGMISSVAGNRFQFHGGDGGPARAGQLNQLLAVGVGQGCNIYATSDRSLEPDLNRVRRVDCGGTITTFAGAGPPGFAGDGGPATSALLTDPVGVVGDAVGNVYIADSGNHRIRMVDPGGTITTYAGTGTAGFGGDNGPATGADLRFPEGVALDAAGNLYVADSANYRVRRIDAAAPHTITTVAGNGTFGSGGDNGPATSAQIGYVHDVALDSAGNLFIADRNWNKVRRVDAVTKTITTVAGNGAFCGNFPCPTGDGGPAIAAQLNSPEGIAFDAGGNLYIADGFNNRVRRVTAGANGTIEGTDVITTVAGNGEKAYGGDGGPATAARLNFAYDVTVDAAGNLYVADFANRRVRRVEAVGPPTAVGVAEFTARRSPGGVLLRWRRASPVGVLGHHVFRERAGRRVRLTRALLPADVFRWVDRAPPRGSLRYWLETVALDGSRAWSAPAIVRTPTKR